MDQFPQMLYKVGGVQQIHGGLFSTLIVYSDEEQTSALADGWHESTPAAEAAFLAASSGSVGLAEPTRAELEQKASELGIKFDGRTTDKKLGEAISAKLAEK